jgi:hypothetical protein
VPKELILSTQDSVEPGSSFSITAGATSDSVVTFSLFASTTLDKPASPFFTQEKSGCQQGCTVSTSYTAPVSGVSLKIWLDAKNLAGTTSKSKTVLIGGAAGGGGGGGSESGGDPEGSGLEGGVDESSSCGPDTIQITSTADGTTFKISEAEKNEALENEDLIRESVFVGGIGFVDSFSTNLTQENFLALYGCLEDPKAQIRFRFGSNNFQTAQRNATIQRSIASFPVTVGLSALSEYLSSPVYSWQVSGVGDLSESSGESTTVQVESLTGDSGTMVVTLTAAEAGDPSRSTQVTLTFDLTNAIVRSVQVGYFLPGQSMQAGDSGTVVIHDIDEFPEQVQLEGLDQNFTSPVYEWQVTGTGSLSSSNGKSTALEVSGFEAETASAEVRLKVSESASPDTFVEAVVTFQFTSPAVGSPPTGVDFSITPPAGIEAEDLVILTGEAQSGIGSNFKNLVFDWSVTLNGTPLVVMTNHHRAVLQVPAETAGTNMLRIELTVSEGDKDADPVVKEVEVVPAEINFAHFGVGPINAESELTVELVVVNDSEADASDVTLGFTSSQGEPVSLEVNGQVLSSSVFSVRSGVAETFTVRSPDEGIWTGWVKLFSSVRLNAIVLFKTVDRLTQDVQSEVALFPSSPGRRFTTALRSGTNHSLGIAVANPTENAVSFEVTLAEVVDGEKVFALTEILELQPMEQRAQFLPEIFQRYSVPEDFVGGTLTIEVSPEIEGVLIATLLRQNEDSLSTVPLAVRSE